MANIFTFTESFANTSAWANAADSVTITQDTHTAPVFAGINAGQADTLADNDGSLASFMSQTKAKGTNDTTNWCVSIFVRKQASASTVPEFSMEFRDGGTNKARGVRIDPVTGATGNFSGQTAPPADHGVEDVDANWWRLWMIEPDNATGNVNIRLTILPARTTSVTAGNSTAATGSVVCWGANCTHSNAVQPYEPDPFYEFDDGTWTTLDTLGSTADSYSDLTVQPGVAYDYRVLAQNDAGSTPSNIATFIPSAALTGTFSTGVTESDLVAGGKVSTITLTGDTFVPA